MIENKQKEKFPKDLLFFFFVLLLVFLLSMGKAHAQQVRTVRLADETVARIGVSARGTVLSFPIKPTKVILGNQGAFGIEYVENDLAVTPLSPSGRSHLFVYLFGRRFSFDLVTDLSSGTAIVLVRDALDVPPSNTKKSTKPSIVTKMQASPIKKK
jgi:hypothetical protein